MLKRISYMRHLQIKRGQLIQFGEKTGNAPLMFQVFFRQGEKWAMGGFPSTCTLYIFAQCRFSSCIWTIVCSSVRLQKLHSRCVSGVLGSIWFMGGESEMRPGTCLEHRAGEQLFVMVYLFWTTLKVHRFTRTTHFNLETWSGWESKQKSYWNRP